MHHYISAVVAAICMMVASLTACSDGDNPIGAGAGVGGDGGEEFRIGFDVMLPYLPGSRAAYEQGIGDYENTINLAEDDYRILLFTHDTNTLLCGFEPASVELIKTSSLNPAYRYYRLYVNVNKEVKEYTDLKLVMLANWTDYPELIVGTTTIDDLAGYAVSNGIESVSSSDDTTFEAAKQFEAKHIPMFGVKECNDINWVNFSLSWLGDLWMLRSVAKIEVRTGEDSPKLSEVILTNYNERGTCAPKNVYSEDDYIEDNNNPVNNVSDNMVYKKTLPLTLPGGKNKPVETKKLNEVESGVFVLYVPEYQIITNSPTTLVDDFAYLQVKFEGYENIYNVYFKYYDSNVASENEAAVDDFFDLKRNYYYRYTLRKTQSEPEVEIYVRPWNIRLQPEIIM